MIQKKPSRLIYHVLFPIVVICISMQSIAFGAAIQPDSVAGLQLWLKADDILDGAEPADGTSVSLWRDRSGGGNDSARVTDIPDTVSDPTKQTVTFSALGGDKTFPVVRFSGLVDELMRSPDIIQGPDAANEAAEAANFGNLTILTVYQTTVRTDANRPVGFGTGAGTAGSGLRGGVNTNNYALAGDPSIRKDNGNVGAGTYSQAVPTSFFIRSSVMSTDGTGSITEFFDGTQVMSSAANFDVRSDNFYVGDVRFRTGDDVDVAEVIVYGSALADADRQGIEEYLNNKYLASGTLDPAVITWGSPTAISTGVGNSSDVSTTGTLVEAFNAVNDLQTPLDGFDVTVGGVLFSATNDLLPGNNGVVDDFSNGTNGGDADYDALLSNVDFGGGGDLLSWTIGDGDGDTGVDGAGLLTVGNQYEIQIWFGDDRSCCNDRAMQIGDGNGNTVDLSGQFVIGTFTANATTQVLTLDAQGFGNAHFSAYQIRAIPEPASLYLMGIGLLALALHGRRRR